MESSEKPGKSAQKREMTGWQMLGAALVALSSDQLRKLVAHHEGDA